jgi:hypothetical protein
MAGFKFSSGELRIEIEDKTYLVNYGDPALQKEIFDFSVKLAATPMSEIQGDVFQWASDCIHDFVARLLGAEAEREIFEGRERNLLAELRLFEYLQTRISQQAEIQRLEAVLGRFATGATK